MEKGFSLFNLIAPVYGLFYEYQKRNYARILKEHRTELPVGENLRVLDVGCGTGALCSVLNESGFSVTGIDPAEKMLRVGRSHSENGHIDFIQGDVLAGLPFEDKSFDVSIASFVAHGLPRVHREKMYLEMSRVTRNMVIIMDYNEERSLLTSFVEWLERGDYFGFIKTAQSEMNGCFKSVRVLKVAPQSAWYICIPE